MAATGRAAADAGNRTEVVEHGPMTLPGPKPPARGRACGVLGTAGPNLPLEAVKIVADGHGEIREFFEGLLSLVKSDGDAAEAPAGCLRGDHEVDGLALLRSNKGFEVAAAEKGDGLQSPRFPSG
jgi:hypothetical protein